jgi:putative FmdB family regulatory protein
MPLYEYHCDSCDETFEVLRRTSDDDEVKCPKCDETAKKQLSWFSMGGASGARNCSPGSGGSWGGG